jgi:ribosome-associated heat shock protein Hsp15
VNRPTALEDVRADKWLWAARLFKSRALAASACNGSRVEVNALTAKPARLLRPGDLFRVTLSTGKRIVKIVALSDRRGPPASARALYEDLTPLTPRVERRAVPVYRPPGAGRPTKRERRRLEHLRAR